MPTQTCRTNARSSFCFERDLRSNRFKATVEFFPLHARRQLKYVPTSVGVEQNTPA